MVASLAGSPFHLAGVDGFGEMTLALGALSGGDGRDRHDATPSVSGACEFTGQVRTAAEFQSHDVDLRLGVDTKSPDIYTRLDITADEQLRVVVRFGLIARDARQ